MQSPPEGFAQTFFVGTDLVVPQNKNLVTTRMDLHFILLRALFEPLVPSESVSDASNPRNPPLGTAESCTHSNLPFLSAEELLPGLTVPIPEKNSKEIGFQSTGDAVSSGKPNLDMEPGHPSTSSAFDWGKQGGRRDENRMDWFNGQEDDNDNETYMDGEDFFQQLRKGAQRGTRKSSRATVEAESHFEGWVAPPAAQVARLEEEVVVAGVERGRDCFAQQQQSRDGTAWWRSWVRAARAVESTSTSPRCPCHFCRSATPGSPSPLHEVLAYLPHLLPDFCDMKPHGGETYYRPSFSKAAHWVARRVERVSQSEALRQFLQIPAATQPADLGKQGLAKDQTKEMTDADGSHAEALRDVAFGLVSELISAPILSALHREMKNKIDLSTTERERLCRFLRVDPNPEERCGDPTLSSGMETGRASMAGVATAAPERRKTQGTPSLSVRKLEKAGKPKGTPTLDFFFAKK